MKNISYAKLIRRILVTTTTLLFIMMAYHSVFRTGHYWSKPAERFRLSLLQQKGTLVSKSFRLSPRIEFYKIGFRRYTRRQSKDQLLLNVKILNTKKKIINEFNVDFSKDPKKSSNLAFRTKTFKIKKEKKIYVALTLLKNNIDLSKKSSYNNNTIRVYMDSADKKVAVNKYYNVFIITFFAMIVFLFIPSKTF